MSYVSYTSLLRSHHPLLASVIDTFYPTSCELCLASIEESRALTLSYTQNPYLRALNLEDYLSRRILCSECLSRYAIRTTERISKYCDYCGERTFINCCSCTTTKKFNDNLRFRSLFIYNDFIRTLIFKLKFNPTKDFCNWLSLKIFTNLPSLYHSQSNASFTSWDCITYVPSKLENIINRNGYSTRYLTLVISKLLGDIPILDFKNHSINRQSSLHSKQRLSSENIFIQCCRTNLDNFNSVLIIDDMLTSGTSSSCIANILFNKGIKRVDITTVARSSDFNKNHLKLLNS
jgi:predicted amidophosphoribosyltransferase